MTWSLWIILLGICSCINIRRGPSSTYADHDALVRFFEQAVMALNQQGNQAAVGQPLVPMTPANAIIPPFMLPSPPRQAAALQGGRVPGNRVRRVLFPRSPSAAPQVQTAPQNPPSPLEIDEPDFEWDSLSEENDQDTEEAPIEEEDDEVEEQEEEDDDTESRKRAGSSPSEPSCKRPRRF